MIATLLYFILFRSAVVEGALSPWAEGSASGGECICEAFFPNSTFPNGELISLESTAVEIHYKLEMEISKVEIYEAKLQVYISKIMNLTVLIELMEDNPDSYSELQIEEVKIEIKQVEALIVELQASIQATSTVLISICEQPMEGLGPGVVAAAGELSQEEEEEEEGELGLQSHDEHQLCQEGICNHGGIRRISKPIISQLNAHLNAGYKYGGWGKDSKPLPGSENMYWYSGSSDTLVSRITQYSDYYNLIMRQGFKPHDLYVSGKHDWRGTGNNYIVRENTLYCQFRSTFGMAKFNMTSVKATYMVVPQASARFSYHYSANQNLDFAGDESGLWVTYATEESNGTLVLGKINEQSFEVEEVWQTRIFKQSVTNAFIICGVLYATRSVNTQIEEIFYTYDTSKNEESHVSILFEKFQDFYVSLDYNPNDQRLYMFNNGYYVYYNVNFKVA